VWRLPRDGTVERRLIGKSAALDRDEAFAALEAAVRAYDRGQGEWPTMTVAGRTIRRDVRAAYSYLASNDPRVHVGLGSETVLRDVSVLWPTGKRERFGDIEADKVVVLRQGAR